MKNVKIFTSCFLLREEDASKGHGQLLNIFVCKKYAQLLYFNDLNSKLVLISTTDKSKEKTVSCYLKSNLIAKSAEIIKNIDTLDGCNKFESKMS